MNPRSFRFSKSTARLVTAALCCLPLGSACSSDDDAPVTPTTFGVEVTSLDGRAPDASIELRCDSGGPGAADIDATGGARDLGASPGFFSTLVVAVATTPTDLSKQFVLRPAHACGSSTRCGYVRIEGLDESGQVLTSVDTATNEGVLELDLAHLPTQVRVSLIRGLDQEILKNPDKTDVSSSVTPTFVVPDCVEASPGGAGGAGGAASGGNAGEAGGDNVGGAPETPAGGAGGDGNVPSPGGAAGAESASSGAGGA